MSHSLTLVATCLCFGDSHEGFWSKVIVRICESCKQLALLLKCTFKGFLLLVNILSTVYPSPLIWFWGLVMLSWMWRLQPQTQHYGYWTMPFKSMEQGAWALTFHYLICGQVHGLYVLQMAQMRYIWAPLPSLSCSGYPNFRPVSPIETLSRVMTLFTWSYTASVFSSTTPEKYSAPLSMQKGRGKCHPSALDHNLLLAWYLVDLLRASFPLLFANKD